MLVERLVKVVGGKGIEKKKRLEYCKKLNFLNKSV